MAKKGGDNKGKKRALIIAESEITTHQRYESDSPDLPKELQGFADIDIESRKKIEDNNAAFLILKDKRDKLEKDNPNLKKEGNIRVLKEIANINKEISKLRDANAIHKKNYLSSYESMIKHPLNSVVTERERTFPYEADKLKSYYSKQGIDAEILPVYKGDSSLIKEKLAGLNPNDDVALFGHSGDKIAGLPLEWWNEELAASKQENCYLGSCYGEELTDRLSKVKNLHSTKDTKWRGVNPKGKDINDAMFSVVESDSISPSPIKGKDFTVKNSGTPQRSTILNELYPKSINAFGTNNSDMAKKTIIKRKPKRFFGAAISAAAGIGTTLLNAHNESKRLEEEEFLNRENANKSINRGIINKRDAYQEFVSNHPEMVYGTNKEIQAFGKGEPLKSLTEGVQVVEAGTHESGNDVERTEDFVEGGETLAGNAVHSNRIRAYSPAQMSASLGLVLDEITRVGKRATGGVKGDLERLGAKVTQKIDKVTAKQEAIKSEYGTEMGANGNLINGKPQNAFGEDDIYDGIIEDPAVLDVLNNKSSDFRFSNDPGTANLNRSTAGIADINPDLGQYDDIAGLPAAVNGSITGTPERSGFKLEERGKQIAGTALDLGASLIDNIANARLLKKTPNVPRPNFYSAANLETEVDVTEQLSSISDQQDKLDSLIDASTASSNTALQRKRASANRAVKAENTVFARKTREEMELRNRKNLNEQRIENMNINLLNNYDDKVAQRENQILSAKSQNISNLSRDLTSVLDKSRFANFQDEQLRNDALKYQDSGIIATTALNGSYDHVSKSDKMAILNTIKGAGRAADYDALKQKWSL